MSIVPASRLSRSDLSRLGNNLVGPAKRPSADAPRRRRCGDHVSDQPYRRVLSAVNRSLARVGERVASLHAPALAGGSRAS